MATKPTWTKDELKAQVCEAIDRAGNEIVAIGEEILHHPETGFNEKKTAALVADHMRALDLAPQTGLALTGVKGRLTAKSAGPRVAIVSELELATHLRPPARRPAHRRRA